MASRHFIENSRRQRRFLGLAAGAANLPTSAHNTHPLHPHRYMQHPPLLFIPSPLPITQNSLRPHLNILEVSKDVYHGHVQ